FSTVPTLAERHGDFSGATYKDGTPVQVFNPTTAQQFQFDGTNNAIDPSLISPAAKALLAYIPLPHLNTPSQNFHYVTSGGGSTHAVNLRLIRMVGTGSGPMNVALCGGGGSGGAGGRRRSHNNINFGTNWTGNATALVNAFPSLAGGNSMQGLNARVGWV